ncbi:hypothetical protein GCM10023085_64010 [Actinomadura viridis]
MPQPSSRCVRSRPPIRTATVQITPAGDGAVLTYTEQSAYFDEGHSAELAEEGCAVLLASLGDVLTAT